MKSFRKVFNCLLSEDKLKIIDSTTNIADLSYWMGVKPITFIQYDNKEDIVINIKQFRKGLRPAIRRDFDNVMTEAYGSDWRTIFNI